MDEKRFDDLTRAIARNISRRSLLKTSLASFTAFAFDVIPRLGAGRALGQVTTANCALFAGRACDDSNPCGTNCSTLGCCGGVCADLTSDASNCVECGRTCNTGYCAGGACCPAGNLLCGATCVDGTSDPANCGACGVACAPGQPCVSGVCGCASPKIACGGVCIDPTTDSANCGSCGLICPSSQPCCRGVCGAIQTDKSNCGACGVVCPATAPACCAGTCVDPNSDAANCGVCANACGSGELCQGGVCKGPTPTATTAAGCAGGTTACGDACVDLTSDPANCGGCGLTCSAPASCVNGACSGGPSPTGAPPSPSPTAVPPSPCTVRQGAARWSVALSIESPKDQLTLSQTIVPLLSDGSATTTILVELAGAMVLLVDGQATPSGGSKVRVIYGPAIGGIKEAFFTSDGKTVRGTIDGRAIAPFTSGSDPSTLAFAGGAPLPKLKIKAGLKTAINRLLKQMDGASKTCEFSDVTPEATSVSGIATGEARFLLGLDLLAEGQPGHRSLPDVSGQCLACEGVCGVAQSACIAGAAALCAGTLFFYGVCLALSIAGCGAASVSCIALCHVPSFPCCPVTCGHGAGSCCDAGETCLDPSNKLCCSEGLVPCNAKLCCHPGETCMSDGSCCPAGQTTCLNVCCNPGEACQNNTTCCPPTQVVCVGVCCKPGEVCNNGTCCSTGKVCGSNCCGAQEDCINASTSSCCGGLSKSCNGVCCALDQECVSGACCPISQRCGSVCCPAHMSCTDHVTGTCGVCPNPAWVACRAVGEPACCPTENQCCANGQCCAIGQPCGGTPTGWVCGAGIIR